LIELVNSLISQVIYSYSTHIQSEYYTIL